MNLDKLYNLLASYRPKHIPWSIVEAQVPYAYNDLLNWAASLRASDIDRYINHASSKFGAVLLWLESEVVRRHRNENNLWEVVSEGQIIHWHQSAREKLFSQGHPTQLHKDVLNEAVEDLGLRNAFDIENAQKWYRLLHLQIGFAHADIKQSLSKWLSSSYKETTSVETLLLSKDPGARLFQSLWRTLRKYGLGNITKEHAKNELKDNPWILPEWTEELLTAAREAEITIYEEEEENDFIPFITSPMLIWQEGSDPYFEAELCSINKLKLTNKLKSTQNAYEIRQGTKVLARIFRQNDDCYINDVDDKILLGKFPNISPQFDLTLVDDQENIVSHLRVSLWDLEKEVNLFDHKGLRVEEQDHKIGRNFYLIAPNDIRFTSSPTETVNLDHQGYCIHRFGKEITYPFTGLLDEFEIWSSRNFGKPPEPLPTNIIRARWKQTLDLRCPLTSKHDAPWEMPIEISTTDTWQLIGLRWTRSDGKLIKWKVPPKNIKLIERDIVKPVVLRATLSNGKRVVTVPLSLPVPFIGCFNWSHDGRPFCWKREKGISVNNASNTIWSIFLPEKSIELQNRDQRNPLLMEGNCIRERIRQKTSVLPLLGGYGAPLYVSEDPYNSEQKLLEISNKVFDGGMLGKVTFKEGYVQIRKKGNFDISNEYKLYGWFAEKGQKGCLVLIDIDTLIPTDEGWQFLCPNDSWMTSLVLTFNNERIGSWFDRSRWSEFMLEENAADPSQMAEILRCWKAPILDIYHRYNVTEWLLNNWTIALPAWLSDNKTTNCSEFVLPAKDEHWLEAISSILSEIQPRPALNNIAAFINTFPGHSFEERIGRTIMDVSDVCPLLAVRILRLCLKYYHDECFKHLPQLKKIYPCTEEKAEKLANKLGGRDSTWLRSTVVQLEEIDTPPTKLSSVYRKLSMVPEYRKYALGVWLEELQGKYK